MRQTHHLGLMYVFFKYICVFFKYIYMFFITNYCVVGSAD